MTKEESAGSLSGSKKSSKPTFLTSAASNEQVSLSGLESYDESDLSEAPIQTERPSVARLAQAKKLKAKSKAHINATTFSMTMLLSTEAILLLYPTKFWIFYSLAFPLLLLDKYFRYKQLKYHLFLLDFCYMMNSCFVASLIAWEIYGYQSCEAFKVMFWCAFGPIANALWLWRNSLVLYDVDKLTSTALHILPAYSKFDLTFYVLSYFSRM